jgi:hypothetical protein
METLPMITPKDLTGGTEFFITIGVCAIAGLLMFLLVVVIVSVLGFA